MYGFAIFIYRKPLLTGHPGARYLSLGVGMGAKDLALGGDQVFSNYPLFIISPRLGVLTMARFLG